MDERVIAPLSELNHIQGFIKIPEQTFQIPKTCLPIVDAGILRQNNGLCPVGYLKLVVDV